MFLIKVSNEGEKERMTETPRIILLKEKLERALL
jgi:hypothetical protein